MTSLVLFDLSAAFETIDRNIFLDRIENVVGLKEMLTPCSGIISLLFDCFYFCADDTQLYISAKPYDIHFFFFIYFMVLNV